VLLEHSAASMDARREGRPAPDLPPGLVFVADCETPMDHRDALRNVMNYLGLKTEEAAGALISRANRLRIASGREPLPSRRPESRVVTEKTVGQPDDAARDERGNPRGRVQMRPDPPRAFLER
jgi:hypothetical protein